MRAFYRTFPIWNAVRTELSWTHDHNPAVTYCLAPSVIVQ